MKTKLILTLAALVLMVTGLRAATPYAVYCSDNSLHFLCSGQEPEGYLTYDGNSLEITDVYEVISNTSTPLWNNSTTNRNVIAVVFEETFFDYKPNSCSYWFTTFTALKTISGLSNLDTSNVESMFNMFTTCSNLIELDLSSFDTSKVKTMSQMFNSCRSLTSLDLSSFDTSNVTDMGSMFNDCPGLTKLNLSSFDTSKVTDMSYMFFKCSELEAIYVSDNFNTDNVTSSEFMFTGCTQLRNFDPDYVEDTNANYGPTGYLNFVGAHAVLADGSSALTFKNGEVDYNQPTYYFLNSGDDAPEWSGNAAIESVVFDESFSTARPTTCYGWFSGCPNLTVINGLGYLNTSEISDPSGIFNGCSGLRLVDMSQVTYDCSALLSQLTENALVYVPESTTVSEGRVNVVVGETCDHFIINYGGSDQNLLSVPYDFTANKVTINRNFEADTPYSLHLPFAMNAIEGGTLYEYTGYTDSTVQFDPVESTEAHTPYMFTPDADLANGIVIDTDVEVKATPAQTADEGEGYIGVYEKKIFTEDDQNSKLYYGWAGDEFRLAGKGASVDACRAYFKLPAGQAAPARISAKFGDGTNGIQSIISNDAESKTPAYNLNGQRVTDSYKGIVIKNGKKILTPAR